MFTLNLLAVGARFPGLRVAILGFACLVFFAIVVIGGLLILWLVARRLHRHHGDFGSFHRPAGGRPLEHFSSEELEAEMERRKTTNDLEAEVADLKRQLAELKNSEQTEEKSE